MLNFLSEYFAERKIDLFAPISLSECEIRKPYLLERAGISDGTAVLIAVPKPVILARASDVSAETIRDTRPIIHSSFGNNI